MKRRGALSVRGKIIAACIVLTLCVLGFSSVVLVMNARLGELALQLYDKAFLSVHYSHKVQTAFVKLEGAYAAKPLPISGDDDLAAMSSIDNDLGVVAERATTEREKSGVAEVKAALSALSNPAADANRPSMEAVDKKLKHMVQRFADDAFERRNQAEAMIAQVRMVLFGLVGLALLASLGMAWFLISQIIKPMSQVTQLIRASEGGAFNPAANLSRRTDEIGAMVAALAAQHEAAQAMDEMRRARLDADQRAQRLREEAEAARLKEAQAQQLVVSHLAAGLQRLSTGDLTCRLDAPFAEQYEGLRADFNAAIEQLRDVLSVVASNIQTIELGAVEVSSAADNMSIRTEQSAARLEQVAAAIQEITTTVVGTTDRIGRARIEVHSAHSKAESSGKVVDQAVKAMGEIAGSARNVSQIIGVIDEIAFQTNLLALNAGVEAARAGDAGRGFAVVATEVRALAQRSAEAAKQIKQLINDSGDQVRIGVSLVGQTGQALSEIAVNIAEVTTMVNEIVSAAKEQVTSLNEVNSSVGALDTVTQQNASMVEETTAAMRNLTSEAAELSHLIRRFQLGRSGADRNRWADDYPVRASPSLEVEALSAQ